MNLGVLILIIIIFTTTLYFEEFREFYLAALSMLVQLATAFFIMIGSIMELPEIKELEIRNPELFYLAKLGMILITLVGIIKLLTYKKSTTTDD